MFAPGRHPPIYQQLADPMYGYSRGLAMCLSIAERYSALWPGHILVSNGHLADISCYDINGMIISAGWRRAVVTKTGDYTATINDDVIICNKATTITITLPAASGTGQTYSIANIGVGEAVIDGNGGDTINGDTTQTIYQYESITVVDYAAGAWTIL